MLAAYNTRRSSVVLNPRGRVLNGLGQLGDDGGGGGGGGGGDGGGGDGGSGDGFGFDGGSTGTIGFDGGGEDGGAAAADASAADAAMADIAAADAAAEAAAQEAAEAANIEAIDAAIAQMDATAAVSKAAAAIVNSMVGKLGLIGLAAAAIGIATGATQAAFSAALSGSINGFNSGLATASSALSDAGAIAGGDPALTTQINILQNNIDAAKKASINAAVTELYIRYAGRLPDVQGLNYWSKQFSPTITPDEVLVFTGTLYANEPHLRPVARTTPTTPTTPNAAQSGINLALPLIAAVAGFLILGG